MENNDKKSNNVSWYLFVGFMFTGMGIGELFNNPGAGLMCGMGLGFIVSAVYRSEKNK